MPEPAADADLPPSGPPADRTGAIRQAIARAALKPGPSRPCPYLPGQSAREIAFRSPPLPPGTYRSLMDLNFRRSGDVIYRPQCAKCRQCWAIRVPVDAFRPDRGQRRCRARNRDLAVGLSPPTPTREKHALFRRYVRQRHDGQMDQDWASFCDFVQRSPVDTLEIVYRSGGRLVAAAIIDFDDEAVSTVYCYYDPDEPRRSLGTYNILWTIDYCRQLRISYLYLGYYIRDCPKMSYKARFRPCEILDEEGGWTAFQGSRP